MKSTKLLLSFFFVATLLLVSCKDNATKEKLVKTWKMVNMGGKAASHYPDSIKQKMYGTRFMELTDEGEIIGTDGSPFVQRGEYRLSDDGKTMYTSRNGRESDTMIINKLTKDTLIFVIKTADIELTWIPK